MGAVTYLHGGVCGGLFGRLARSHHGALVEEATVSEAEVEARVVEWFDDAEADSE